MIPSKITVRGAGIILLIATAQKGHSTMNGCMEVCRMRPIRCYQQKVS